MASPTSTMECVARALLPATFCSEPKFCGNHGSIPPVSQPAARAPRRCSMIRRSLAGFTRLHKTLLVCLLLVPFCAASDHWAYEETHTDFRDFAVGGILHVRLSVGDLRIMRGESNQIHLRYTVKSRRDSHVKAAKVDFEVRGRDASIECHAPSGSNTQFDVELEVPPTTNLDVHEKVGDLTVEDIEGDKDLTLNVGDIRIDNGQTV